MEHILEPMQLSINTDATGEHIRRLIAEKNYTVNEIQQIVGLGSPQAVYKWFKGTIPKIDSLLILSRILDTTMEEILVTDEDLLAFISYYRSISLRRRP